MYVRTYIYIYVRTYIYKDIYTYVYTYVRMYQLVLRSHNRCIIYICYELRTYVLYYIVDQICILCITYML